MGMLCLVHRAAAAGLVGAASLALLPACVPPSVHERFTPEVEGPADLPGFTRVRTIEFPGAADGWLYSYRGSGLRPDVYIYPVPPGSDGRGAARLTRLESTALKHSLSERQRQGWFGHYRVERDEPVVLDIGGLRVEGHRLVALIRYPDEEVVTHQYIFQWGSHFVRVRESHSNGSVAEEQVEHFVRLLLAALATSPLPAGLTARSLAAPTPIP